MLALFRRHPVLVSAFALALIISVLLMGRIVLRTIYFAQHREEPVAAWMTIGYIGRSWGFDPREIDAMAGMPPPENGRPFTLQQIAEDRGMPVTEVIAEVEAALEKMQAEREANRPKKAP